MPSVDVFNFSGSLNTRTNLVPRFEGRRITRGVYGISITRTDTTCRDISISVQAITNQTVRVTFSSPVENNHSLLDILNYSFSPYLNVTAVAANPSNGSPVNFVDLTVEGLRSINYTLSVLRVEAA